MLESQFQSKLIRELRDRFPGCVILKNDAGYIQGIPDLLILYGNTWAALECKRTLGSRHRPNQDYYVNELGQMSFASFIAPENMMEVLDDLQEVFATRGEARFPQRQ